MIRSPLLTWKGRRVRSAGDGPETAARKVPEAPRPGSLFFVPSPLEGWGLDALLRRLPADSAVVVFEKDGELTDYCSGLWQDHLGALAGHPRLFRLNGDTEASVLEVFENLPLYQLRRCEFLTLNGAWMAHGPRYREVFARFEQGLARWWSNRMTCMHMGPLWIRNLFDNLSRGFQQTRWPSWQDDAVVVCGAGTSLESALPWIREQRQNIRLVAADTALAVLRDWNLVPDAVVCLEAQHANLADFAGWLGRDVALFADLTSFPPATRIFSRPPHWFVSEFAPLSLWRRWPWADVPRLPPLGSVGVAAAWIAWRLSSGPVILAGLDFAYPAGKTHARGAPPLRSLLERAGRLNPPVQRAWDGEGIRVLPTGWLTTPVMTGYAEVLADQAASQRLRTWQWDLQGLPLGLLRWPGGGVRRASQPRSQNAAVPVLPWLEQEKERLQSLLKLFERLNRGEAVDLEAPLAEVDYLTFTFPDPEFRAESDWLSRALVQVRWLLSRLRPT